MAAMIRVRNYVQGLPRVFWTYLLSYLMVILLPIVILSYASYSFTVATLEDEMSRAMLHSSTQKNASIEEIINEMQSIAIRIGLDGRLESYLNDSGNQYLLNETRDILKTFSTTNEAIASIDFYAKGANLIVSSDGYTRTYTNSQRDLWIDRGQTSAEHGFWLSSRDRDENNPIMTYVLKVPVQRKDSKGLLALHMYESSLKKMLQKTESNAFTTTYILDESGNVITSSGHSEPDLEHIKQLFAVSSESSSETGYGTTSLSDGKHLLTYVKTLHTNWTVVSETPLQYLLSKLSYIRSVAWMTFGILMLLGVLLSYVMSRRMYSPIKSLMDKSLPYNKKAEFSSQLAAPRKNELETISQILDNVFSRNEAWEQQFRTNLPALRERFLLSLLNNKFSSIHEINSKLEFLHLHFPHQVLAVFVIEIDEYSLLMDSYSATDQNLYKYAIVNIAEEIAAAGSVCLSAESDENQFVLLVNLDADAAGVQTLQQKLQLLGEEIKHTINQLLRISVTIGIGNPYSQIMQTHYCYKEASEVIRAKIVAGTNMVLLYDDLVKEADDDFYLPPHFSTHLINFLKAGQLDEALSSLNELYMQIKARTKLNEEVIFRIYSLIIEDLLRNLGDMNVSAEKIFGRNHHLFRELAAKETVRSIHEWMCGVIGKVHEAGQQLQPKKNGYIDTVTAFMDQNYHLDLSVETISEQVNLHYAYLSRMFKQETGKTILEYLTIKRLEVSKGLLKDTEHTVNDIASGVGYNNVNSFIRFFKRYEGLTPGDYRKSNR
ncbi:helix-turn-helix domain-containing protein [Paenibacillus pasadenensis]|uniref:helix-turn-helix domain-containing protein n=1 Tax=Paenibacillus pasadenensis TaxID=217090 RepID=UPI00203CD85A|nr:helix-turn-helix domain-containing protein [Paenibacillus pasadenensis]MCM3748207.1 helix-turn-helix domain-containing protein [Paenibacillus pasadenensis]